MYFLNQIRKLDKFDWIALGILAIAFKNWLNLLIFKYSHFGYQDWDLAFFSQAMWNLATHGSQYSTVFDNNLLGNHANIIAYLLIPLYKVAPHPFTLILIKLLFFLIAAFIFYRYAKEKLGWVMGLLCMILYLLFPPNIFAIIYEFDFESLCPLFLFLLYIFYVKEKLVPFLITAFFTILIKENMPFIVFTFGITAIFSRRKNKILWIIIPILLSTVAFFYFTKLFVPHFAPGGQYPYLYLYSAIGGTPEHMMGKIALNPLTILDYIIQPLRVIYCFELFSPIAWTSFFSLPTLLHGAPIFLQRILANAPQQSTIYYYYVISFAPFIFLAMVNSFGKIRGKSKKLYFLILVLVLISFSINLKFHWRAMKERIFVHQDHLQKARWDLVRSIPKDAHVTATFDFLSELSNRKFLYPFYRVFHTEFDLKNFDLPNGSYALIDFHDPWLLNEFFDEPVPRASRIFNFFKNGDWQVVSSYENLTLFKKENSAKDNQIASLSSEPFKNLSGSPITIDRQFQLLSLNISDSSWVANNQKVIPLAFYWKSIQDVNGDFYIIINLMQNGRSVLERVHRIGQVILPTIIWRKENYIKENYWLSVSDVPKGEYELEIRFMRQNTERVPEAALIETVEKPSPEQGALRYKLLIN